MELNQQYEEFIDTAEKHQIAKLNLLASKVAKSAAAFEPARQYAEHAMQCVEEQNWKSDYQFMFDLYSEATDASFLSGNYELTEKYANFSLKHATNIPDELKIIQIKLNSLVSQNKQRLAVDLVIKTLARTNIVLPPNPTIFHVLLTVLKTKVLLLFKDIPSLLDLPEMTDPINKAIVRLITSSISSAYQALPNMLPLFVCTSIKLSLKHGNTLGASVAYVFYGVLSCGKLLEIDKGYQFGELALNLADKLRDEEAKTKVSMANYCFIKHWKDPLRESLPKLSDTFENGLNSGDPEYASYCAFVYVTHAYFAGIPIKELLTKTIKYKERVAKLQQLNVYNYISLYHQLMLNLIEIKDDPSLLIGEGFDESTSMPSLMQKKDRSAIFGIYANKIILSYIFDKYQHISAEVMEWIRLCDSYVDAVLGMNLVSEHNFYKSLILIGMFSTNTPAEQAKNKKIINSLQKKMKKWLKFSPANYLNKYLLVEAEKKWIIDKNSIKASELYDQAIKEAKKNEFLYEEALANELAAKFYLAQGKKKIARVYMEDARHCYLLWGADAKISFLDKKYPDLLENVEKRQPHLSKAV